MTIVASSPQAGRRLHDVRRVLLCLAMDRTPAVEEPGLARASDLAFIAVS